MLKGFSDARLACGCRLTFRDGVQGSPVTAIVDAKGATCAVVFHVQQMPIYDHREALRPPTRIGSSVDGEHEEEG